MLFGPVTPGLPFPLGVRLDGTGVNFALASRNATAVILCLIDDDGNETHIPITEQDAEVWHVRVPHVTNGQRYGYRVDGPWDPGSGLFFNARKLVLDPYARAITGDPDYSPAIYGADLANRSHPSQLDSAGHVPVGMVWDCGFDWGSDAPPRHRYSDTVIYETHVKGISATHPDVPEELRGTYAGLAHPVIVEHLQALGVTAVELLPVQHFITEPTVHDRGLVNYWGYNTLGFFAPHARYSAAARSGVAGGQVDEFRAMVKALHQAGIEVILDVVYNHTAEGGIDGPTLSFRGIVNPNYYRLAANGDYYDTTGCGNAINASSPLSLRMIMDSLRYWITEMHVDGFRFDLAATLGREDGAFTAQSTFFDMVNQDPIVGPVKLIAEPWDVGQMDSYDIGRFPQGWREWNGPYRGTIRDYWRGADGVLPEYASRITGSADLFHGSKRRPTASVNFVTVHDGFTLRDLVSYDAKHNLANKEDNRDGTDDNRSWNCGVEGPTGDPAINALRASQSRAMLTTLLTSFGMPMLNGGDEIGRTQQGNNNAYCQDSPTTWFDWASVDHDLLAYTQSLTAFRAAHPVLRRHAYLTGSQSRYIKWFTPDGEQMDGRNWRDAESKTLQVFLDGSDRADVARDGTILIDDDLLIVSNAYWEPVRCVVPLTRAGASWSLQIDSLDPTLARSPATSLSAGQEFSIPGRTIQVWLSAKELAQ